MEIDRLLLSPASYYFILVTCVSHLGPTAWLCVKIYTSVELYMIFVRPVLRDRFCWAEGVVAQDRFYCIKIPICNNYLGRLIGEKLSSM